MCCVEYLSRENKAIYTGGTGLFLCLSFLSNLVEANNTKIASPIFIYLGYLASLLYMLTKHREVLEQNNVDAQSILVPGANVLMYEGGGIEGLEEARATVRRVQELEGEQSRKYHFFFVLACCLMVIALVAVILACFCNDNKCQEGGGGKSYNSYCVVSDSMSLIVVAASTFFHIRLGRILRTISNTIRNDMEEERQAVIRVHEIIANEEVQPDQFENPVHMQLG